MHAGPFALAFAAAYLGAALYSVLVEQPARLTLDDRAMVEEWTPSDRRGIAMLAVLALAAAIAALVEYRIGGNALWLLGAAFAMASWPYMFFVVVPINNRLLDPVAEGAGARGFMTAWGFYEWGQVGLGVLASGVFAAAL
ncbi:MAG: anthrone oxygenase family protein [Rhodoblastus sp.]